MQDDYYTFTIPFDNKPAGLPDWATGHYGHGRNGTFKAAGVECTVRANAAGMVEVDLRNLTSKGLSANQAVVMPPAVMDELGMKWLVNRSLKWRRILARGVVGLHVETQAPHNKSDGDRIPERAKGIITEAMAAPHAALVLATVDFGVNGQGLVSLADLCDPAKFQVWEPA